MRGQQKREKRELADFWANTSAWKRNAQLSQEYKYVTNIVRLFPLGHMRKTKVRYDADEDIIKKGKKKQEPFTVDYNLESELKLQSQLDTLHKTFKAPEPLENYILCYGEGPVTYLNFEEQLRAQIERIPQQAVLIFRNVPSIRAHKFIEALTTAESDIALLKDILFGIRYDLYFLVSFQTTMQN